MRGLRSGRPLVLLFAWLAISSASLAAPPATSPGQEPQIIVIEPGKTPTPAPAEVVAAGHFGLAGALVRGDRDLSGAAREWWEGISVLLRDPESLYYLAGNGLLVIYLGLCWGGAIALVLLALRAAPALFHDLKERSS